MIEITPGYHAEIPYQNGGYSPYVHAVDIPDLRSVAFLHLGREDNLVQVDILHLPTGRSRTTQVGVEGFAEQTLLVAGRAIGDGRMLLFWASYDPANPRLRYPRKVCVVDFSGDTIVVGDEKTLVFESDQDPAETGDDGDYIGRYAIKSAPGFHRLSATEFLAVFLVVDANRLPSGEWAALMYGDRFWIRFLTRRVTIVGGVVSVDPTPWHLSTPRATFRSPRNYYSPESWFSSVHWTHDKDELAAYIPGANIGPMFARAALSFGATPVDPFSDPHLQQLFALRFVGGQPASLTSGRVSPPKGLPDEGYPPTWNIPFAYKQGIVRSTGLYDAPFMAVGRIGAPQRITRTGGDGELSPVTLTGWENGAAYSGVWSQASDRTFELSRHYAGDEIWTEFWIGNERSRRFPGQELMRMPGASGGDIDVSGLATRYTTGVLTRSGYLVLAVNNSPDDPWYAASSTTVTVLRYSVPGNLALGPQETRGYFS